VEGGSGRGEYVSELGEANIRYVSRAITGIRCLRV